MGQISLDWDTVKSAYPMRPLSGALKTFMDSIPGTPCCVQMSHALGAAGAVIGTRSNRRLNSRITTPIGTRNYLLAVDEMKWFLENTYGRGEELSSSGGRRRAFLPRRPARRLDDQPLGSREGVDGRRAGRQCRFLQRTESAARAA